MTATAVLANRHRRGLLLDPHGPDARQAGSVFLNPPVTAAQATHWSAAGCPVHTDSDGQLRAGAGWLLKHTGYRPGYKVADDIRRSERRTLTLTTHNGATAAGFAQALTELSAQVETAARIKLRPEPDVGRHPGIRSPVGTETSMTAETMPLRTVISSHGDGRRRHFA